MRDVLVEPTNCSSGLLTKTWFKDTDISQLRVDIRKLLLEMKDIADIKMKENGETKEEHDDNDDDGFEILSPSPLKKKRRKEEEKKNVEEESKKENKTPQPAGGFLKDDEEDDEDLTEPEDTASETKKVDSGSTHVHVPSIHKMIETQASVLEVKEVEAKNEGDVHDVCHDDVIEIDE